MRSGCFLMGWTPPLWDAGRDMTTAPTDAPLAYRRATRDTEAPIVGGVAAGLARHLGWPVIWVRVGFVGATALSGLGVALYAGFWLMLPADTRFQTDTPGAESASRGGRRPGVRRRLGDVGPLIVLATLGLGAVLLVQATLGQGAVFWSIARRHRRAWACCGARPTRCSASAGSPRAGWIRCGSCSAAAAGRRTPGCSSASAWWSPRCSSSASTAGRFRRPGWPSSPAASV